jgi:hypothetical protein
MSVMHWCLELVSLECLARQSAFSLLPPTFTLPISHTSTHVHPGQARAG